MNTASPSSSFFQSAWCSGSGFAALVHPRGLPQRVPRKVSKALPHRILFPAYTPEPTQFMKLPCSVGPSEAVQLRGSSVCFSEAAYSTPMPTLRIAWELDAEAP